MGVQPSSVLDPASPLEGAIADYVERLKQRNRGTDAFPKTRTHATYGYALHAFVRYLADTRALDDPCIDDLVASDLTDYTRWLRGRYQDMTQQLYVTAAKQFLQYLLRRKLLPFDFDDALAEWEDERPRIYYPTPEVVDDADKILAVHRQLEPPRASGRRERQRYLVWLRDQALLELLFATGARISEALSLSRADVRDGRAQRVTVRGKGDKSRVLPLTDSCRATIRSYLAERTEMQAALFISHAGRTPGQPLTRASAWSLVTKLARAAELDGLSPHGIRRWLATMALRDGADLKTISAALGHSSTGVTEKVYAFVAQEAVAAAWGAATEKVHQRRKSQPADRDRDDRV